MPREQRPGRPDEALGTRHSAEKELLSLRVLLVQRRGEDVAHWVGQVPNLKINAQLQ